jgi:hypothetical protein
MQARLDKDPGARDRGSTVEHVFGNHQVLDGL